MEQTEILKVALEAALEKKASDPVILKIAPLSTIADFFLICSGQSTVQVRTIRDHLQKELESAGLTMLRKEGAHDARWLLLDYGWFVAHIMLQGERDFYQLERLWHDAERFAEAGSEGREDREQSKV
ncbi:MAG: ribosome silencing factor [Bacteroidota bacterium]